MIPAFQSVYFYKVVSLNYKRDVNYYERVLDITDQDVSAKVLPRDIEVTPLSFNQFAGYLIHKTTIKEINVVGGLANGNLPQNAL